MEMNQYVKGKRTINATETAYLAIYKAQGFVPKSAEAAPGEPPAEEVGKGEGTEGAGADGGGAGHNGKGASAGKPKGAKP